MKLGLLITLLLTLDHREVCFLNEIAERPSYMWVSMTWTFKFCGFRIHLFIHSSLHESKKRLFA